jgi:hypothetical protein
MHIPLRYWDIWKKQKEGIRTNGVEQYLPKSLVDKAKVFSACYHYRTEHHLDVILSPHARSNGPCAMYIMYNLRPRITRNVLLLMHCAFYFACYQCLLL